MQNSPSRIYHQAIIVLDTSSVRREIDTPSLPYPDESRTYLYPTQTGLVDSGPSSGLARQENLILKTSFSSLPVISQSELNQEYQELGRALSELTELDQGNDWKVDAPVYATALFVAAALMASSYPAPRIFSHGPKSVVFNWCHKTDNLYLTISADKLSALISSPQRIKRRLEFSTNELPNPALILLAIGPGGLEQQSVRLITETVSDQ